MGGLDSEFNIEASQALSNAFNLHSARTSISISFISGVGRARIIRNCLVFQRYETTERQLF